MLKIYKAKAFSRLFEGDQKIEREIEENILLN